MCVVWCVLRVWHRSLCVDSCIMCVVVCLWFVACWLLVSGVLNDLMLIDG